MAIGAYNNMTGYQYTNADGTAYDVIFDLSAKEASNPMGLAEKDPAGNYYITDTTVGSNVGGKGGLLGARINPKHVDNTIVNIHELGHTLGAMAHSAEGYMVREIGKGGVNEEFLQENINEIIEKGESFGPIERKSNEPQKQDEGFWSWLKNFFMGDN